MKSNLSAFAFANPVSLRNFDFVWPIHLWQLGKQLLGISSNPEEPLFHRLLDNDRVAAPAFAVNHLLVGENRLILWTPPLQRFFLIGQILFKQLSKYPLRPFVVFWVASINLARPIDTSTDTAQLFFEIRNIVSGSFSRFAASFDSVILGRQAKAIPANRIHYVITERSAKTRHRIDNGMLHKVAGMHTCTAWIREHARHIVFWLGA